MKAFSLQPAFLIACILYIILIAFFWDYTVDDAYISYRYAENLASGNGLVFNSGERVEGYSNLLWVLLLAPIGSIAGDITTWSKVLAISAGLLILLLGTQWEKEKKTKDPFLILPILLAGSLPFAAWTVAGLETTLYTLLLFAGFYLLRKTERIYWGTILIGLSGITRPEGVLYCLIAVVFLVIWERTSRKRLIVLCLIALLPVLLQVLFRLFYYESWLPNTYYAKMDIGTQAWIKGFGYLQGFFFWSGILSIFWLLFPLGFHSAWKRNRKEAFLLLVIPAAQFFFILKAGGDWMKPYRFIVPVLPFLYLGMVEGFEFLLSRLPRLNQRHWRWVILFGFVSGVIAMNLRPWGEVRRYTRIYSEGLKQTSIAFGKWLAKEADPGDWVALGDVGALPYYSGLQVIDLYGLVNPDIARLPGASLYSEGIDTAAILARKPRYIVLESHPPGEPFRGLKRVDQKLYLEPDFQKEYVLVLRAPFSPSEVTCLFERRDRRKAL